MTASSGEEMEEMEKKLVKQQLGEQAVAWVVVVLDYLFGLPVTSGGVGVLESR